MMCYNMAGYVWRWCESLNISGTMPEDFDGLIL